MMSWKLYPSWFMFVVTVFCGVVLVVSSGSWFMAWVGLELTVFGFLPMVSGGSISMEGLVKYFLIQAGSSAMFVGSFLTSGVIVSYMFYVTSLSIKMGLAPFHQWVPSVVSTMSWLNSMLLLTLQKVAPVVLFMKQSLVMLDLVVVFGVLSTVVGGLGGFNQSLMRPLMAYSSIAHSGWTVMAALVDEFVVLLYYSFYVLNVVALFVLFDKNSVNKVYEVSMPFKDRLMVVVFILSLGAIPPSPLFLMKVLVLMGLVDGLIIPALLMLLNSALTVYFYMYFVVPSMSAGFGHSKQRQL